LHRSQPRYGIVIGVSFKPATMGYFGRWRSKYQMAITISIFNLYLLPNNLNLIFESYQLELDISI
jgi:hypothetical protein